MKRRTFVQTTVGAFAGIQILPASAKGANERVNLAFIGVGGKGAHAIKSLRGNPLVHIAAFADVDERSAAGMRTEHPTVPFDRDFRKMLDQNGNGIDGVVISTPDHTHHCAAKWCLNAGKAVYLEKPLTHNIAEARDLMKAEAETGIACQMGNQGHSGSGILLLEAWVKAGVFGDVREAHAWAGPLWTVADQRPTPEEVPAGLDWDLWLGPAAQLPYSSHYLPARWRAWSEFGCGTLGDWACHNMDAPYTVFGLDCPSRVEIKSSGPSKLSFPQSVEIVYTFAANGERPAFKLTWHHGPAHRPPTPEGWPEDKPLPDGGTLIIGPEATALMGTHAGTPRITPDTKFRELAPSLPRPDVKRSGHYANWLLAIKGEEKCRSNFAYGGRLTETMHFGSIAMKVNRSLTIDPVKREIVGDDEAAALVSGPVSREGCKI